MKIVEDTSEIDSPGKQLSSARSGCIAPRVRQGKLLTQCPEGLKLTFPKGIVKFRYLTLNCVSQLLNYLFVQYLENNIVIYLNEVWGRSILESASVSGGSGRL